MTRLVGIAPACLFGSKDLQCKLPISIIIYTDWLIVTKCVDLDCVLSVADSQLVVFNCDKRLMVICSEPKGLLSQRFSRVACLVVDGWRLLAGEVCSCVLLRIC